MFCFACNVLECQGLRCIHYLGDDFATLPEIVSAIDEVKKRRQQLTFVNEQLLRKDIYIYLSTYMCTYKYLYTPC